MPTTHSIILAAGRSARLRPLTNDKPKCLLPMGPKTILDWQLDSLQAAGVQNVVVVVGYRREMIVSHIQSRYPHLRVQYVENPDFETTNTLFSLKKALEVYDGDFYYLNADVVFDERILERLIPGDNGGYLAIDRKQCREEEVKVLLQEQHVAEIGKHLDPDICYGEFIGVAKFAGEFAQAFRQTVFDEAKPGNEMKFFEYALDAMADKSRMFAVDITGLPCVEVDFPEDYDYAVNEVLQNFRQVDLHD
ncbi:phosphocholine cytidylyltransferase family protein [Alicyclobacillus tolerans]|uniref:phosphocholine cytidylyltransferase family protein n=1 Tax=Alicyclobacillus tolerans TaxID=90970 RepID=UPI001F3647BF|nr:phosphocholine cytidylyltransferase family protein [Alicyclobacillus tolerans]MCF8566141.1 phosphocholine cytidylyltransferase family protein [Alicyclobacillus tolerans]